MRWVVGDGGVGEGAGRGSAAAAGGAGEGAGGSTTIEKYNRVSMKFKNIHEFKKCP